MRRSRGEPGPRTGVPGAGARLGWLLAAILLLAACDKQLKWEEETTIPGYGDILVLREIRLRQTHELGGPAGWDELGGSLQLIDPSSRQAISPPLEFFGDAMLVDRNAETGRFEVVAALLSCKAWWRNGRPDPAYMRWELTPAGWQPRTVTAELIGRRENLLAILPVNNMPPRVTPAIREFQQRENCSLMREVCVVQANRRITTSTCPVYE